MAKELITRIWCDNDEAHVEQVDARPYVVAFDGKPQEIDLCDDCAKRLVEPLRELLAQNGQPVGDEQGTDGKATCPECGVRVKALRKHLQRRHGEEVPGDTGDHACPDCDRRFETPQGLGAHRNRSHGYVSPNRAA